MVGERLDNFTLESQVAGPGSQAGKTLPLLAIRWKGVGGMLLSLGPE